MNRLPTLLVGLLLLLVGCGNPSPLPVISMPTSSASSAKITAATTSPLPGQTAAAVLDTLPVKGRAPLTGYTRNLFMPHGWEDPDHNGCDARRDALARQAVTAATAGPHHCVLTALIRDPYSGTDLPSIRVDIDHVVALADAYQTGAFDNRTWTPAMREQIANDPLNLLAVSSSLNRSKGDRNAASWLPPTRSYRCSYVARQIAVKQRYRLWVTPPEKAVMAGVLTTCPAAPIVTLRAALRY